MAAKFKPDKMELPGLEKLTRALKSKPMKIRIGVLKGEARADGNTNSEIGAVHEFGSPAKGIPQRSFLRMPLQMRLAKAMKYSGALDKNAMRQVLKEGTIRPWLAKIASLAEAIVAGAFESAGYGQWPAWKNKNYINEAMMLLVDSGQLRDSISSEIKEDK